MSVTVKLTPKGLFGKKVTIEELTADSLAYGIMDEGYRLKPDEQGEHTIIYDPKNIARGIDVSFENNGVTLQLSLPSSPGEIKLFYEIAENMCRMWRTNSFDRDGEKTALSQIESCIACDINTVKHSLSDISNQVENENSDMQCFRIFGARIPLSIGLPEVRRINKSPEEFESWLNEKQQLDAYYASPRIFKNDAGLFGVYFIGADIVTVVPTTPHLIMNQIGEIPTWYVAVGENCEMVLFSDFIANVKDTEYFDAEHIIVKLGKGEAQKLLSQYEVKL